MFSLILALSYGAREEIVEHLEACGVRKPCAYRLGMEAESWLN